MTPRLRTLGIPSAVAVAVAVVLAMAVPAQGAAQPDEAPEEFRNGDENGFGSVTMEPYLPAGDSSVPVQAHFVLHDLETLGRAADVLFAFNLKGDSADVTLGSLKTADGKTLTPVQTLSVEGGRQPQAHFDPAVLLAVAEDGRIEVVLDGRVEAKANGQAHLGAMVIAFDEAWGTLRSNDGPAQVYGFTIVMANGVAGGGMPFQGQGNTWAVLPVAFVAFVLVVAGLAALHFLRLQPPAAPVVASPAVAPPTLVFGSAPARPPAPPPGVKPPASTGPVLTFTPQTQQSQAAAVAPPVPVFGGPASPALPPRPPVAAPRTVPPVGPTAAPIALGPMQGPLLPPHPLDRSHGLLSARHQPPETPPTGSSGGPIRGRPQARPAARATSVHTATRRPKAGRSASR